MTTPTEQTNTTGAATATYLAAAAALRARLLAYVAALYAAQGNYRDAAAAAFVASAVPAVQAAQQTMAALTSAYLAHLISTTAGGSTTPIGISLDALSSLRGVDPAEVYRRPYVQVWTDLSRGKPLDTAVAAGERRAQSIAATDLQLAKTHAAQQVLHRDHRVVGYRRVLTGATSCGLCVVASTVRYHKQDLLPIHPGCVVEGTLVSASGVGAVTRRLYTGELTIITTAAGDQLTVTPNHPILTDQGWIPSHLLRKGDSVIRCLGDSRIIKRAPHERHSPALIEDVWRSASMAGFVCVPLTTEDFHGDGADSEVNIVWTDGNFPTVGNVTVGQPPRELTFVDRWADRIILPSNRSTTPHMPAYALPSDGFMGSSSLRGSLFGGHLCSAHKASIRSSAGSYTGPFERSPDSTALHTVLRGESQLGGTLGVLSGDDVVRQFTPGASSRRFDPASAEFSGQGLRVYAELGRGLLNRLAREVEVDRVIEVRRVYASACHVYNLHTSEGWYAANNHIISNCDCAIAPITGSEDPGRMINSAILGDTANLDNLTPHGVNVYRHDDVLEFEGMLDSVHQAVRDRFGQSATDARSIDYRKVITVQQHSEIGPILTVSDHLFTKKDIGSGNLRAKPGTFGKSRR